MITSGKLEDMGNLLRRALLAQIELGTDEVVLTERRARAHQTVTENSPSQSETRVENEDDHMTAPIEKTAQAAPETQDVSSPVEYKSLVTHNQAICDCQACPLGETRTKFVYGVGNPNADLMFIGEAPGADEDQQGEPFVGRAGKLLDKIIIAMGLTREQIYIANILKCRPPQNRDPQPAEMEKCFPYLKQQVRLVKPKVICALGRISAQALLDTNTPLGKLRDQWHEYEGVPLRVTYHPAALLRFQQYKRPTWEDMQEIMKRVGKLKGGR